MIIKNKKHYIDRFNEAKADYNGKGWQAVHEEKTKYLYPFGRNLDDSAESNDGNRKDEYILNNTALLAIRTAVAGIFAGSTPPLEKWFRLADEDKELNEIAAVSEFYQKTTDLILLDMSKSNCYSVLELVIRDLLAYNISAVIIDSDPDKVFNFSHIQNGQYYIEVDSRGEVAAIFREFRMRARNVVEEYGESNVSQKTKGKLEGNKTGGAWVSLLHVIERNTNRDVTKEDNRNMPWKSITYELGGDIESTPLRESGYSSKPFYVPRWSVPSGNIYGSGPSDDALGDVKQLQKLMTMLNLAVQKELEPPMLAPTGVVVKTGPNDLTYVDDIGLAKGRTVEPLYRITPDISKLVAVIIETQERIKSAFFANLFFAQGESDPRETATLTIAKQRELLRLLGPAVQRLNPELLQPKIMRCFDIEYRMGRLPDIPPELEGRPIKIEILSALTKAQELSVVTPIQELVAMVGQAAQIWPEAIDKLDVDQTIDEINGALGIPAGIIRPDEVVEEIRALRAQEQARQQQAMQEMQQIENAKQLSETKLNEDNALSAIAEGAV